MGPTLSDSLSVHSEYISIEIKSSASQQLGKKRLRKIK